MGKILLITGGARSGKSDFAQSLAEKVNGSRVFIATCPPLDRELKERIRRHKESRKSKGWLTIEETTDLKGALLRAIDSSALVVDCLTLWVNNLIHEAGQKGNELSEDEISSLCTAVLKEARKIKGISIFVTNEVGMGIVPENQLARNYRDLLGRCNQVFALGADEVILMVSGIPVPIKPNR